MWLAGERPVLVVSFSQYGFGHINYSETALMLSLIFCFTYKFIPSYKSNYTREKDMIEQLQKIKDAMMQPIYEKRRHLGCELCGVTFYGYYQKTGLDNVPNGEETPHPTKKGWVTCHTYDDVFYPDCPECGFSPPVSDAKSAIAIYNHEKAKAQKKAERKAKKDAQPVRISARLTYPNKQNYEDRLNLLAKEPDKMTKYEMMCDYFLDKVFWKRFGKGGRLTMRVRNFSIEKRLHDGRYKSNSGKSTMGYCTPFFVITNIITGKVRRIGIDAVRQHIELDNKYGKNRRNDPKRNFGLPE